MDKTIKAVLKGISKATRIALLSGTTLASTTMSASANEADAPTESFASDHFTSCVSKGFIDAGYEHAPEITNRISHSGDNTFRVVIPLEESKSAGKDRIAINGSASPQGFIKDVSLVIKADGIRQPALRATNSSEFPIEYTFFQIKAESDKKGKSPEMLEAMKIASECETNSIHKPKEVRTAENVVEPETPEL